MAAAASSPPESREDSSLPPAGGSETDLRTGGQASRVGAVAVLLRRAGIRCGPHTAGIAGLAEDPRITDELIDKALELLAERPAGSYGPQVVLLKVRDLLQPAPRRNGPAADFPAWRTDDSQCDRLGKALGLWPNPGEEYPQYRQRISAKLNQLREQAAA